MNSFRWDSLLAFKSSNLATASFLRVFTGLKKVLRTMAGKKAMVHAKIIFWCTCYFLFLILLFLKLGRLKPLLPIKRSSLPPAYGGAASQL